MCPFHALLPFFAVLLSLLPTALFGSMYQRVCKTLRYEKADKKIPFHQKLGQMFIVGFQGTRPEDETVQTIGKSIRSGHVGGVILFSENIESPDQLKCLTHYLKSQAPFPLMVCIDQEGGAVTRLSQKKGFPEFPSAWEIGQATPEKRQKVFQEMAKTLMECGINVNLAPVVDLAPNAHLSGLNQTRFYSHRVDDVIQCARDLIRAHHDYGIATCLKHFPGHGYAKVDSHDGIPDVTMTYQDKERDPFESLSKDTHVSLVMGGHLKHKAWGDLPLTLTPHWIKTHANDIRKRQLFITDDLGMGAIIKHNSLESAVMKAIVAGNDFLILGYNPKAAKNFQAQLPEFETLFEKVQENVPEQDVETAFRRILKFKETFYGREISK